MGLTVFWTNTAIESLEKIFDFYKTKASLEIAQNIIRSIVDRTILLEDNPEIGPIEELLKGRKNEYRYLVISNYKIIYWISEKHIMIVTVFDCRQNPIKLKKI
jgi:plasmid stabilization system protein ParE